MNSLDLTLPMHLTVSIDGKQLFSQKAGCWLSLAYKRLFSGIFGINSQDYSIFHGWRMTRTSILSGLYDPYIESDDACPFSWFTFRNKFRAFADEPHGIIIGSSNLEWDINDYCLGRPYKITLDESDASRKFSASAMPEPTYRAKDNDWTSDGRLTDWYRSFTNLTVANQAVRESGIAVIDSIQNEDTDFRFYYQHPYSGAKYPIYLLSREVWPTAAVVAPGSTLAIQYSIGMDIEEIGNTADMKNRSYFKGEPGKFQITPGVTGYPNPIDI